MSNKIEEIDNSDIEEGNFNLENKTNNNSDNNNPTYLAFIDSAVKLDDELTTEDTFIGGKPIWLVEDSKPNDELLNCKNCKNHSNMKLLLQSFAPLDEELMEELQVKNDVSNLNMSYINADDDRVLYIFICTKCQGKNNSINVLEVLSKINTQSNQQITSSSIVTEKINSLDEGKKFDINPFDLSNNANPFANGGDNKNNDTDNNNPFSNSANPFASISNEKNQQTKENDKNEEKISIKMARKLHDKMKDKEFNKDKEFKNYLLYVEEETFKNKKPDFLKLPKNLKINKEAVELSEDGIIEKDTLDGNNPIKLDPRTERLSKFLDDDTFQKFQEIIGYNPGQVLRYNIGGEPLLYSKDKHGIKNINDIVARPSYNPSSKRIFEMQLMPKMILDLEEDDIDVNKGMEWGTVMIFSDLENYIPEFDSNGVGYVEELVKVQWEIRDT
ncbi:hypothetical protein TBLA_0C01530 [Henningerozyma blattae CBS 6284]|uniref:Programmed cell death protein 2 C-terminal domain-containing protein n=1 Tax=Henningerozyma blattae (strain ATCC 34711 / CBS 6284 / DSM 70876 / NBRC 10599 / NRRL Y-10934 / UCD 77-7) TaxID=1071380 RepID=I2H0R5_HENB6|nr:hypothetical protein TBLA_0C01530 [Tetrapisispora blattae CBS 6284]CCH59967.1 hypothetical protein TBLA_0C01530 [Tetrapisispora blattae CBS 6284]